MIKNFRTRGGTLDVKFNFVMGLLSYNRVEFEKDNLCYEVRTWIFMFIKYEEVIYRCKNIK